MLAVGGWLGCPRSLLHVSRKDTAMKKIDIKKVPELATKVGIHGSVKQREVGGAGCGGIFLALVTG
jgi:hypothetical protein